MKQNASKNDPLLAGNVKVPNDTLSCLKVEVQYFQLNLETSMQFSCSRVKPQNLSILGENLGRPPVAV